METIGDSERIKNAIEKHFSKQIKAIESETETETHRIQEEALKRMEIVKAQAATEIESAVGEARSRVLNEEKLKAKRAFEEAREELIQSVFRDAEKKMESLAKSPKYVRFVKAHLPKEKDARVVVGNSYLKRHFKGARTEKGLNGVKVEGKGMVYDLSLDGMLRSKKEAVRERVTKELFGE